MLQGLLNGLCLIRRGRNIPTTTSPVDVNVFSLGMFLARILWFDAESVSSKIISLRLDKVGGQVFGPIAVIETQGSAESRGRNSPQCSFRYDVAPPILCIVNSFVKEVIEQEVLKIRVLPVRRCNILQED